MYSIFWLLENVEINILIDMCINIEWFFENAVEYAKMSSKSNNKFLETFSFQPVHHDWFHKGRGMCYPVCGMKNIKEPLLLIGKSSPCGGSGFPISLSE